MDALRFSPFEGLGKAIKKKRKRLICSANRKTFSGADGGRPLNPARNSVGHTGSSELDDHALFLKEMEGVVPLDGKRETLPSPPAVSQGGRAVPKGPCTAPRMECHALMELKALVDGSGLISLRDTGEFVSGGMSVFSPLVSEALHSGHYSVQAYLDLHGMDVESALVACDDFLKEALCNGLRCVAFIHGRGLGSKRGPVLKRALIDWLERGPYRRRLVAYSSAPPWDGGTGVTYCLLKRSPYRRQGRKRGVARW